MSLRVVFDIDDEDLDYFRASMKRAQSAAASISDEETIRHAAAMIEQVSQPNASAFVQQRVQKLASLIQMLQDPEWPLSEGERRNILCALSYFANPEDIIPDHVPVLGYIDDAIMIELVVRDLKPEIEAFEDFCNFRAGEMARHREERVSRQDYLESKRRELQMRMRRRRRAAQHTTQGRARSRLFLY